MGHRHENEQGRQTPPRVRFWTYTNGPVRITLARDQELTWRTYLRHEEGWASETVTWRYDGQVVEREWCNDGRDCDGRLTNSGRDVCPVADLAIGNVGEAGIHYPLWQKGEREVFDEYAVAAGY